MQDQQNKDTSSENQSDRKASIKVGDSAESLVKKDSNGFDVSQLQVIADTYVDQKFPIQRKNNTGLPDQLKSGIENLSGYSMDDVKVHYNSDKPAQLQAHAYAQGNQIHLAPGQEKHLPHEAWHVVQQKQGRVKPTKQLKAKVNINDDERLEKEADKMGAHAMLIPTRTMGPLTDKLTPASNAQLVKIGDDAKGDGDMIIDGRLVYVQNNTVVRIYDLDSEDDDNSSDGSFEPEDDPQLKRGQKRRRTKPKKQKGSHETLRSFRNKDTKNEEPRRKAAKIEREQVNHPSGKFRTTGISAMVEPRPTKGRPGAPEPDAGPKIGVTWKEVEKAETRDTGIVDAQKGHLMALELGGPDIKENIVGQWGQWQANGAWRKAEVAVLKKAEAAQKDGNQLHFEVVVKYKKYEDVSKGTQKGVFFPIKFTMKTTLCDSSGKPIAAPEIMYDDEQFQDSTDDMMAHRVMDQLDEESAEESEDSSDEEDEEDEDEEDEEDEEDAAEEEDMDNS